MIVYNVTVKIDQARADEWLTWMRAEHIPQVVATGLFSAYRMCRIMVDDEDGGVTYATQYSCASRELFDRYVAQFAADLRDRQRARFSDSYVAIRTIMQVVEEQTLFASAS